MRLNALKTTPRCVIRSMASVTYYLFIQLMVVEAKTHNFERLFDFNSKYLIGLWHDVVGMPISVMI